ncbi:hypoxanthine phosphoribosyltransferase [Thermoflavifilum thermophilum]|uniref:Hypoxanthine phosphoribosyltransferase n=1 Tax=Thermoflavifilum thermophilum TaxID=1393122 RepID=A0A1I7NEQ0_9BACT|nr:hypoxanthine phosphoribosyltransferase [Thermoflavifilum thermophilum]SFV33144.1 hypoxanthine phosphoribosyltransferase [Thermoflavifilum thermophilum]
MHSIQVHDKIFVPYLSQQQIQQRIAEMAQRLNQDLAHERPLFLAILNGAFMFAADLFRQLTIEAEISFIKLVSYKGTRSTGHVITSIGLDEDLYNRTVVILEDIVDTGKTLHEFLPQIHHQHPRKLLITALLSKPDAREFPVTIDYLGFSVPNRFLLGYGLDYDGLGRNLPEIYQLKE